MALPKSSPGSLILSPTFKPQTETIAAGSVYSKPLTSTEAISYSTGLS